MSRVIGLSAAALLSSVLCSCAQSESDASPRPVPPVKPAATPEAIAKVTGTAVETEVPLESDGGTFLVPVTINNALTLKFTIDSGAANVHIPEDVASTLVRTGTITRDDVIGNRTFVLADGSTVPGVEFRIRKLQVGTLVLEDVIGSVGGPDSSLLLGQSFLSRLSTWSIDNKRAALVLRAGPGEGQARPQVAQAEITPPNTLLADEDLARVAAEFRDTLEGGGIAGVSSAVEDCYASVLSHTGVEAKKRAAYCITYDLLSARFDSSFRKALEDETGKAVPATPYFEDSKWQSRVALYLPHTGLPQSDDTITQFRTYVGRADRKLTALIDRE